jgi:diguanylate cyclase (GGDEF)-like protein
MWILTLRSPASEPHEYVLKPGKTTLGRKPDNDIVIVDDSASRLHAEIFCQGDLAVVYDLGSTNGTFVNRERLSQPHTLRHEDQIRIGQHVGSMAFRDDYNPSVLVAALAVTRSLTRDLLLESVDQHAILMYEIAGRLNTILELDDSLREVSDLMRVAMGVDKCEVILAERFGQLGELGFPTSIARQAIEQRAVIMIPDLSAQADPAPGKSGLLLGIRSVLCVPVLLEQAVVALLYVYKTDPAARPFDQHDVQLAVAISHQAALTIQRAQLLEKARAFEQRATTDSLTSLHNRQQILELAEREFQRALRLGHPLAALMVDIDNFKQVNDTYGHAAGDQVLRAVAACAQSNLREIDLLGRYGGDEFVVLLLETELGAARRVAERIRAGVADMPVDIDQGPLKVTISVGVVLFTDACPNVSALLNDADVALYSAKKAGKNQIAVKDAGERRPG